jgi:hypothetical protein
LEGSFESPSEKRFHRSLRGPTLFVKSLYKTQNKLLSPLYTRNLPLEGFSERLARGSDTTTSCRSESSKY